MKNKKYIIVLTIYLLLFSVFAYTDMFIPPSSSSDPNNTIGTVMHDGDVDLTGTATNRLKLPLNNAPATPTFTFGDGDTGIYQQTDNELQFSANGLLKMHFTSAGFTSASTNGFFLVFKNATTVVPSFVPSKTDEDTGLGWAGADRLSLIAGAVEGMRIDKDVTAGNTRLLLYDVDNATLERVTVGIADSGGAGYKVLRIPN